MNSAGVTEHAQNSGSSAISNELVKELICSHENALHLQKSVRKRDSHRSHGRLFRCIARHDLWSKIYIQLSDEHWLPIFLNGRKLFNVQPWPLQQIAACNANHVYLSERVDINRVRACRCHSLYSEISMTCRAVVGAVHHIASSVTMTDVKSSLKKCRQSGGASRSIQAFGNEKNTGCRIMLLGRFSTCFKTNAGVGEQVRGTSLFHSRRWFNVINPDSNVINYTVVCFCFMMRDCSRKL